MLVNMAVQLERPKEGTLNLNDYGCKGKRQF